MFDDFEMQKSSTTAPRSPPARSSRGIGTAGRAGAQSSASGGTRGDLRRVREGRARAGPPCAGAGPARDLLAHLLVRERQPWVVGGIMVTALAPITERAMRGYADTPWAEMIESLLRSGPPIWSPFCDPRGRRARQRRGVLRPPRGRAARRARLGAPRHPTPCATPRCGRSSRGWGGCCTAAARWGCVLRRPGRSSEIVGRRAAVSRSSASRASCCCGLRALGRRGRDRRRPGRRRRVRHGGPRALSRAVPSLHEHRACFVPPVRSGARRDGHAVRRPTARSTWRKTEAARHPPGGSGQ